MRHFTFSTLNALQGLPKQLFQKTISLAMLVILLCSAVNVLADDWVCPETIESKCAKVKIELSQDLALERQTFVAHINLNNGLTHIPLENVDIEVTFHDQDGNAVTASSDPSDTDALFFIRVDQLENIDAISGSGTIEPSTSADVTWLIVPSSGAAGEQDYGTLYYVGATLSYTVGGNLNTVTVVPDHILVKPMPVLVVDYFLPLDVYGDDAFTSEIEAPVPFAMGLQIRNNGFGSAKNFRIENAQPKIVENDQGLLIGSVIKDLEINGEPAQESFLVNFGDIEPGTINTAIWTMTCSLSGQFTEFTADFTHEDELGGALTSLVDSVNTHILVKDVLVDIPGRDGVRDFLTIADTVYGIYESDNPNSAVTDLSASSSLRVQPGDGPDVRFTLSIPAQTGFIYAQILDPYDGRKTLGNTFRSDGKRIKAENIWLSKTRRDDNTWQHFINLFDSNTGGSYTLVFQDPEFGPRAPVLQLIPDRAGVVGHQLSFIVEASDPDGTIPTLSTTTLPAGAGFTDQTNGTGIFDWTPAPGQEGRYEIVFKASDGGLETIQKAVLGIYSGDDADNDGMPDQWETDNFSTLDRDGTEDFDGDGI